MNEALRSLLVMLRDGRPSKLPLAFFLNSRLFTRRMLTPVPIPFTPENRPGAWEQVLPTPNSLFDSFSYDLFWLVFLMPIPSAFGLDSVGDLVGFLQLIGGRMVAVLSYSVTYISLDTRLAGTATLMGEQLGQDFLKIENLGGGFRSYTG